MATKILRRVFTGVGALFVAMLLISSANAQKKDPYMGAPVSLGKAPNGAITNQKLLDGIEKVGWLKPTIEEPVEGVWVFGGYGLAPISVIDTDEGSSRSTLVTVSTMANYCWRPFAPLVRSRSKRLFMAIHTRYWARVSWPRVIARM